VKSPFKIVGTASLVLVLFGLTQFSRSIVYALALACYQVLLNKAFGRPAQALAAATGFNAYDAFFWAKIIYTGIMAVVMIAALRTYSYSKAEFKVSMALLGAACGMAVLTNVASKVFHSGWLQTFSRDILEVLTSPFPVLFLIPVLILYRNTQASPIGKR
jgi:hypothetical protein